MREASQRAARAVRPALVRVAAVLAGLSAVAALAAGVFVAWPLPDGLLERRPVAAVRFTDRDGGLLREVASRADGRSVPLPRGEPVPPRVRAAFVAAEDARFERHPGVDPLAVARAGWQLVRHRRVVSGASTLTMQLARALVPHPRTAGGKLVEALWALRLEAHLGKDELLRAYLDRVPLGGDLYGVEAAAALYFGRPARTLSAAQAALLAGLARAPSALDPLRRPEASRERALAVLGRMEALGLVGAEEARLAREAPLDLAAPERSFEAPHLVEALSGRLGALGLDAAAEVETALDRGLQRDVEELVRAELAGDPRLGNVAVIVVDNASGEVLAYVGSADFLDAAGLGQNDGVRARRQPGSALKPFAYGLALARGYTAASVLSDVEVRLATPTGDWVPRNYDRRAHGPVPLRAALQNSYNVPAVRLAEALGPERVLRTLRAAGFESLSGGADRYGAGVVLGNGDVTLRELARAYRGLARGGLLEPLREVRAARDAAGRPLPVARELAPRRFLPAGAVALLTDILSDEAARAPAFGVHNALRLPFPVAAKTGTSRAYVDNWTAGYTAERTVAVWVGSFDGRPMQGVSGITGAGPVFARVMVRAMRGIEPAPLVDRGRFTRARVCPLTGLRAGTGCPGALEEVFLPGTAPSAACAAHAHGPGAPVALAPELLGWARAEGIAAVADGAAADAGAPRVLLPADGDEYLVEAGYPEGAQGIPLRLALPPGTARAEVRVGGERLALGPPFAARLAARPGRHRLEVWLPGGAAPAAVSTFTVRGAP
ncbi:glycosyl transferase, family 51 / Penicillin-binding protein, transpeptidase [Anaeromyxobacter dehalogenans 2CP-C]|uniref:peptidoglycan glycosyltransferase n=1 Tax=Anaeromyxobacter dehalogenans (strain 2CP-C) TaxID=290397 RepID=Q2IJH6_ANADE|nr:glycosyl transferase, family 51 / Penicillin-binding protein, transpeptidase [Anaeromyxobacter dehalogenans 2CP-C]